MPMYEMPLIFVFGVGESILCIGVLGVGVLSSAFCPEITVQGSVSKLFQFFLDHLESLPLQSKIFRWIDEDFHSSPWNLYLHL